VWRVRGNELKQAEEEEGEDWSRRGIPVMGGKRCCISPAGEAASREELHVS
jgi:hypothetical protein